MTTPLPASNARRATFTWAILRIFLSSRIGLMRGKELNRQLRGNLACRTTAIENMGAALALEFLECAVVKTVTRRSHISVGRRLQPVLCGRFLNRRFSSAFLHSLCPLPTTVFLNCPPVTRHWTFHSMFVARSLFLPLGSA